MNVLRNAIRLGTRGAGLLIVLLAMPANAQQCNLHRDCGPGKLCAGDGTCKPVEAVLGADGGVLYWVDQARGDDANQGTQDRPWKTIQRAAQRGALGPGDAVLVREGTYYGTISPQESGRRDQLITYAAYPGDKVVVSGAKNIPGTWTRSGDVWSIAWPFEALWTRRVNEGHPQDDPARRRDVLIAGGRLLQAVYRLEDVKPGTFFLKGSPNNPTTMYVRLEGDQDPNTVLVQTSRVNHLFNPSSSDRNCLSGTQQKYLRLIGFTFRYAANEAQQGAVCSGSEGTLIEDVTVEWTNGAGFLIGGERNVVRGAEAYYNGMSGIRGESCNNCLLEYSTSRFNNWKGYDPFWESGGGKWLYTTNSTFRHLNFSDNEGPGLWIDMDNMNNVIEQSRFDNNYGVNIFIEYLSDKNVIRNNVSTRARYARPAFFGYGLLIHAANNNMVAYNTFMGNEGGGVRIRADGRGRAVDNKLYNNLYVANLRPRGDARHRGSALSYEEHASANEARSNRGDGNAYWGRSYATERYHTFQFRPRSARGNNVLRSSKLKDWQSFAKTDYASIVTDRTQPAVVDTADYRNGWRLAAQSQLIGKAVPLPEGYQAVLVDFDGNPRPASGGAIGADQPGDINDAGPPDPGDDGPSPGDPSPGNPAPGNPSPNVLFTLFDAITNTAGIALVWQTTSETGVERYVLERSLNQVDFEEIGVVAGGGTTTDVRNYQFTDARPPAGMRMLYYRVRTEFEDGSSVLSSAVAVNIEVPTQLGLMANYPNPFNPYTTIPYALPEATHVRLTAYDLLGRAVATLVDREQGAGWHEVRFEAGNLTSGVYLYRIEAGGQTLTGRMTLLK